MEIAFFAVPEINTNAIPMAASASPKQEFSFLLASMLKSAQPATVTESGLPEPNVNGEVSASEEGALIVTPEGKPSEEPELEGEDVSIESASAAPETPVDTLAPLFVPVELPRPVEERIKPQAPAVVIQRPFIVNNLNMDTQDVTEVLVPEVIKQGQQQAQLTTEGKAEAFSEPGRMELSKDLRTDTGLQEHFEVEIPAEDIIKQAVDEPYVEPALVAAGEKTFGQATEGLRFKDDEPSSSGAEISSAGDEPVEKTPPFQGFEAFDGGDSSEENTQEGASIESGAIRPENATPTVSFEKVIEAKVSLAAPATVSHAPVAAEVHEKVQAGLKVSLDNNGGEVKMKLNPESLGEVRIKLSVNEGMVKAEIVVENPEIKSIIEADSSFLRESLGAHGLTLDKCVVEVGRSFDARGREANDNQSSPNGDERQPMKDREEEKGRNGWQRNFRRDHALNEDGGVDFFI